MLYFDRVGVSEGTDVNKTSESKECDIYFKIKILTLLLFFQTKSLSLNNMSAMGVMIFQRFL